MSDEEKWVEAPKPPWWHDCGCKCHKGKGVLYCGDCYKEHAKRKGGRRG